MNRVTFLIDGFNLYHSIIHLQKDFKVGSKWIDLRALFTSYIHLFGKDARLEDIYYFSAIPFYLQKYDPGKIRRHQNYISCLRDTGVKIELGKFKYKEKYCNYCHKYSTAHEEKETDVSIGVKMLDLFINDKCDTIVLVTGDSDLIPAIKVSLKNFPNKNIACIFPYKRINKETRQVVGVSYKMNKNHYQNYTLPDPVILSSGEKIFKPKFW